MGDERIEALEQRIVELGDDLMRLQREVNYLRGAAIYTFGALDDLSLNSDGLDTADYRDKLGRISANIKRSISVYARLENSDEPA